MFLYQVFDSDGDFLFTFGTSGEGNGQFNAPTGIAVDSNDNIIVADWGNSRIQVSYQYYLGACKIQNCEWSRKKVLQRKKCLLHKWSGNFNFKIMYIIFSGVWFPRFVSVLCKHTGWPTLRSSRNDPHSRWPYLCGRFWKSLLQSIQVSPVNTDLL